MQKSVLRLSLLLAIVCVVLAAGGDAVAKGPCICPQIYAPVECANGKTYPNQCVASCRNQHDCTPTGELATDAADETAPVSLTPPAVEEITQCAAESGVELRRVPFDDVELGRMASKGKGKPDPCTSCAATLGTCARYSCSPCCYTCPDTPYLLCTE